MNKRASGMSAGARMHSARFALRCMHAHPPDASGWAWPVLSDVAGVPDMPLPQFVGPRTRMQMTCYTDAGAPWSQI